MMPALARPTEPRRRTDWAATSLPFYLIPSILETNTMGGGGKIPYPKHVWSPAGGWYGQPHNWKTNTAVCGLIIAVATGMLWKLSAEREVRYHMPEPDRFFPSRK